MQGVLRYIPQVHKYHPDCARRLFALGRMVDVLLHNLARIHDLWPLLLDHLVELLGDPQARPCARRPSTRSAARSPAAWPAACAPGSRWGFPSKP